MGSQARNAGRAHYKCLCCWGMYCLARGVGLSHREGMSRSISDSKRHSPKPATQLSFIPMGRSKQLNILGKLAIAGFFSCISKRVNDVP